MISSTDLFGFDEDGEEASSVLRLLIVDPRLMLASLEYPA
jgi:hypothetical protein